MRQDRWVVLGLVCFVGFVVIFSLRGAMAPYPVLTKTPVTPFPTVNPANIPDGLGGGGDNNGCMTRPVECSIDDADNPCAKCGDAFQCTAVSSPDSVHLNGATVPGGPGKHFCLPHTPQTHNPTAINMLTTRLVWSETGCPQGVSQCWKKLCKYPNLFNGENCDNPIACKNGADLQANNTLVESTCALKEAVLVDGACYANGAPVTTDCENYYVKFDAGADKQLPVPLKCQTTSSIDYPPYVLRNVDSGPGYCKSTSDAWPLTKADEDEDPLLCTNQSTQALCDKETTKCASVPKTFANQHWMGFLYRGKQATRSQWKSPDDDPDSYVSDNTGDDVGGSGFKPTNDMLIEIRGSPGVKGKITHADRDEGGYWDVTIDIENQDPYPTDDFDTFWVLDGTDDNKRYAIMIPLDTPGNNSYGSDSNDGTKTLAWDGIEPSLDRFSVSELVTHMNKAMSTLCNQGYQLQFDKLFHSSSSVLSGHLKELNTPALARVGSNRYAAVPSSFNVTENIDTNRCPDVDNCPKWRVAENSGYRLDFSDTIGGQGLRGIPSCVKHPFRPDWFSGNMQDSTVWGPDKALGLPENSNLATGSEDFFRLDDDHGVQKTSDVPDDIATPGRRVKVVGTTDTDNTDTDRVVLSYNELYGQDGVNDMRVNTATLPAPPNPVQSYYKEEDLAVADPLDTVLTDVRINTNGQINYTQKLIESEFEIMNTEEISFMLDVLASQAEVNKETWFNAPPKDEPFTVGNGAVRLHHRYKPVSIFEVLGGRFDYQQPPPVWNKATKRAPVPWEGRNKLSGRIVLQSLSTSRGMHDLQSLDSLPYSYYTFRVVEALTRPEENSDNDNGTFVGKNGSKCIQSKTPAPHCGTSLVWDPFRTDTSVDTLTNNDMGQKNPMGIHSNPADPSKPPEPDFVCSCDSNSAPRRRDGIPFVRMPDDPYSCHIDPCYSSASVKRLQGFERALDTNGGDFRCNCGANSAEIFRGSPGEHIGQCGLTSTVDETVCGIKSDGSPLGSFDDSFNTLHSTSVATLDDPYANVVRDTPPSGVTLSADQLNKATLQIKWAGGDASCKTEACYPKLLSSDAVSCTAHLNAAACNNAECIWSSANPFSTAAIECVPTDLVFRIPAGDSSSPHSYSPGELLRTITDQVHLQHTSIASRIKDPLKDTWNKDNYPALIDIDVDLKGTPQHVTVRFDDGESEGNAKYLFEDMGIDYPVMNGSTQVLPTSTHDFNLAREPVWREQLLSTTTMPQRSRFGTGCACNAGSTRGVCTSRQTSIPHVEAGSLYNFRDDPQHIARPADIDGKPQSIFSQPVLAGTCDFINEAKVQADDALTGSGYVYLFPDGHEKNLILCRGNACMPNNVCACQQVDNPFGEQCYDWCSSSLGICGAPPDTANPVCKGLPNTSMKNGEPGAAHFACSCKAETSNLYGVAVEAVCATTPLQEPLYSLTHMMSPEQEQNQIKYGDPNYTSARPKLFQKLNEKCFCEDMKYESGTDIASISYNIPCNSSTEKCTAMNSLIYDIMTNGANKGKYGEMGGQFADDYCYAYSEFHPEGTDANTKAIQIADKHFLKQNKRVGDPNCWKDDPQKQASQAGREKAGISTHEVCSGAGYANSYPPPSDPVFSNYPIGNSSMMDTSVTMSTPVLYKLWNKNRMFKEPPAGDGIPDAATDHNRLANLQIIGMHNDSFVKFGVLTAMTKQDMINEDIYEGAFDAALFAGAVALTGGAALVAVGVAGGVAAFSEGMGIAGQATSKFNFAKTTEDPTGEAYYRDVPARMSVTNTASQLPRIPYQWNTDVSGFDGLKDAISGSADEEVADLLQKTYSSYCDSGNAIIQTYYNIVFDDTFRKYIKKAMADPDAKGDKNALTDAINKFPRCYPCVTTQVLRCSGADPD